MKPFVVAEDVKYMFEPDVNALNPLLLLTELSQEEL